MARLIRIPGLLDPHVHLRGMEWSHKGTFASETAAALAGGYTAVLDMPNTVPSTVDRASLDRKLAEMGAQAVCDGLYIGASQSDNTCEYPAVFDDVCGLKIYNNATTGNLLISDQTVRRRHYQAWPQGKVIAVHAEGETILEVLELVRDMRKQTHFCHISTAQEIEFLGAAKAEGLPISIGVCPHHLYLTEPDVSALGALGRMKPELKTAADCAALWDAISRGVVDVIESDHAPHTLEEKSLPTPPSGVPGLETNLPLMLLAVHEGRISLDRVLDMLTANPRRIFGAPCEPDTYTVVDLDAAYTIERHNLHTLCGWSPFEGMRVVGKVREVWLRGTLVFDGEEVLALPGSGRSGREGRRQPSRSSCLYRSIKRSMLPPAGFSSG
jgi:carbamoyl-phosphate synthase/aspartate carbamoyltransferase/dihydroorotase